MEKSDETPTRSEQETETDADVEADAEAESSHSSGMDTVDEGEEETPTLWRHVKICFLLVWSVLIVGLDDLIHYLRDLSKEYRAVSNQIQEEIHKKMGSILHKVLHPRHHTLCLHYPYSSYALFFNYRFHFLLLSIRSLKFSTCVGPGIFKKIKERKVCF